MRELPKEIDHEHAQDEHVLDYPATSVRSNVKIFGFDGNHKLSTGENGGGFRVNRSKTTGTVNLMALNRNSDGEEPVSRQIRVQFDMPIEVVPDIIAELEQAVEDIKKHAEERGYDGIRFKKSQSGDGDD